MVKLAVFEGVLKGVTVLLLLADFDGVQLPVPLTEGVTAELGVPLRDAVRPDVIVPLLVPDCVVVPD